MATLQVKRLPDELYLALKQRAAAEGLSLSELVTRMLRRDLAFPSVSEWLRSVEPSGGQTRDVDIERLIDDVRDGQ